MIGEELQPDQTSAENRDREAVLLVNTKSLKGAEWFEAAKTSLLESGFNLSFAQGYQKTDALLAQLRNEIAPGKLIIVGGGDGTLSAAANELRHTGAILGVLPLGTGNAFARDLDIPTDVEKAVEIIKSGDVTEVDLGVCGERAFVNVVTVGLTSLIAENLTGRLKRKLGRFVYAFALVNALREIKPFEVTIETDNGVRTISAVQVVIGNGHYHGGPLPLAPTASITSGKLRLYAVEFTSKLGLLRYALLLPTGLQGLLHEVHSEETKGGKLTTHPSQAVVVDGEIGPKTPLEFHVDPLSLQVMTPKKFAG